MSPHFYVARNLSPETHHRWCCGQDPDDGDHPSPRLRSIVGPAACGKSTFLHELALTLPALPPLLPGYVLLPLLDLAAEVPQDCRPWLAAVRQTNGLAHADVPPGRFKEHFGGVVTALLNRHHFPQPSFVLLADGFDELSEERRAWAEENLLVPFLFPGDQQRTRVILTRRDEAALHEANLHWEDEVLELQGLDVTGGRPRQQVMDRLAAVAGRPPDEVRELLEWPASPDAAVAQAAGLDEAARVVLADGLRPFLTPNPYINLLLLQAALRRGHAALDTADLRACLDAYVQRAGLPPVATEALLHLIPNLADPEAFTVADYRQPARPLPVAWGPGAPGGHAAYPELEQYMAAGIASHIPGTARYRFDPAIIHLVAQSAPALVPEEK